MARGPLAQPAVFPYGRKALRNGRLEPAAGTARSERQIKRTRRVQVDDGQKKARLKGRADKGLEIFFVNEKVCFGKQQ